MLDLIFPKKDINNKNLWKYISEKIKKDLIVHDEICYKCKKHNKNFITHNYCQNKFDLESVITCFYYTNNIKKYILSFKYFHKKDIVQELWYLMNIFFNIYLSSLEKNETLISFVPMHFIRKHFLKGYNQSEVLANKIWELQNIKVLKIAKKTKNTKPQSKIKKRQLREKNIKNTFKCLEIPSHIKNLIIVDDVLTSWSTISELTKTIKNKYNINIYAIVLARK